MAAESKPNEIQITRVYDAPVESVWDAWADPAQTDKWWGPRGFTTTTHTKDLRPGGSWTFTMHGPDGVDYPSKTVYLEVEKYKKLVYDHGGNEEKPPLFRVTVLFSEINGKTRMEMTMALPTAQAAAETRQFIRKVGGNTTWDRLAEYLAKEADGKEQFVINRSFDAPIDLMFSMWTDPAHFSQWAAPKGFAMEFVRADIRPGGGNVYFMTAANGARMYGKVGYREIHNPDRLVYTQEFCDENERVSRHPMSPTWPQTMLTTVQLSEEGPAQTRVTITWEPFGAVTPEEVDTFIKARAGMTQGWTGSFDKLEAYLADQQAPQ